MIARAAAARWTREGGCAGAPKACRLGQPASCPAAVSTFGTVNRAPRADRERTVRDQVAHDGQVPLRRGARATRRQLTSVPPQALLDGVHDQLESALGISLTASGTNQTLLAP